MRGGAPNSATEPHEPESYLTIVGNVVAVLVAVAALGVGLRYPMVMPRVAKVSAARAPSSPVVADAVASPVPRAVIKPVVQPPAPPKPSEWDQEAVARAEAALDRASRDRARAEARAAAAARQLELASALAASQAKASRTLAYRVHDPSDQIARTKARGGFLRAQRDKIQSEVNALRQAPRPQAKLIGDRSAVAKPIGGEEFHFELRRNRISFIDLDRLLSLVRSDAQLRIRLSDNSRIIESQVGPVGAFSLQYTLGRALPRGIDELIERHGISFDLRSWELVPVFEKRGETFEATRSPVSEFTRAINRLNPSRATITMWVYPDGFALYRKLRDDLHARGYMVAARPLPEAMPIRGSPAGSLSAGQ